MSQRNLKSETNLQLHMSEVIDADEWLDPQLVNMNVKLSFDGKYHCPVCQKEFSTAGSVHRHFRIHAGDKVYLCKVCNKKFNRNDNMVRHMRFVHFTDGSSNLPPRLSQNLPQI